MTDSTIILIFGLGVGTLCGYGVGFVAGRAFEQWFGQWKKDSDT